MIPAGTGFKQFQQSEVRIRPQALEELAAEKHDVLGRAFPLLDSAPTNGDSHSEPKPTTSGMLGGSALDNLLGGADSEMEADLGPETEPEAGSEENNPS